MEEEFPRHGYFYLFKEYFKAGSTYCFLTFYGLVLILTIVVICATDYWLGYWTNIEDLRTNYMTRNNSDHIPKGKQNINKNRFLNKNVLFLKKITPLILTVKNYWTLPCVLKFIQP